MHATTVTRRWIAGAACVALTLGAFAPTAEAGHRRSSGPKVRAWEGTRVVERVVRPHRTVVLRERHSDAGPAIAGLIGGLVIGATLANASQAVEVRYAYHDPYCDLDFASFGRYERHVRHCDHPRVVRVIDSRSGDCVHTYAWRRGDWRCVDDGDRYDRDRCDRDHRDWDRRDWDRRDWDDD